MQDVVPEPPASRWRRDAALRRLLGPAVDLPAVSQVLDLCGAPPGPPPASWGKQMAALLSDNAEGIAALRMIALRETPFEEGKAGVRPSFVGNVVRAIGLTDPGEAIPLLVHITDLYGKPGRGSDYRVVALTAIEAISRVGGERALPALRQIRAEAKLSAVRRAASQALDEILAEAHLSRADVPEWQAETFELDREGLRVITVHRDHEVMIQLDAGGTVTLFYRTPSGQRLLKKPAAVKADIDREARDIAANLRTVVYAERFRLKQLMKDQRSLTYQDWMEYYLGNPVTGQLCRSLVWESSIDGGEHWQRFLPLWSTRCERWLRLGENGVTHDIAEESQARVVHPKHIAPAEARAWIALLRERNLTQPFKQVGRK